MIEPGRAPVAARVAVGAARPRSLASTASAAFCSLGADPQGSAAAPPRDRVENHRQGHARAPEVATSRRPVALAPRRCAALVRV